MAKKQLTISIPTPCTEDWNTMTPDKNGKFCASCEKTVIDFSRMTDAEIIYYFDNFKGATCGRFNEKQLNTPINEPLVLKPQNRWAWALSALLLPTIAVSQTVKMNEPTEISYPSVFESKSSVGTDFLKIHGEVNELGSHFLPVDGAIVAVIIKDKIVAYRQTDSLGIFSIDLPKAYENQSFILEISQIGFEKEQLPFDNFSAIKGNRLFISLKNTPINIEQAVVCTGYGIMGKTATAMGAMTAQRLVGGVVAYRQNFFQRSKYRIKNLFRQIFRNN